MALVDVRDVKEIGCERPPFRAWTSVQAATQRVAHTLVIVVGDRAARMPVSMSVTHSATAWFATPSQTLLGGVHAHLPAPLRSTRHARATRLQEGTCKDRARRCVPPSVGASHTGHARDLFAPTASRVSVPPASRPLHRVRAALARLSLGSQSGRLEASSRGVNPDGRR